MNYKTVEIMFIRIIVIRIIAKQVLMAGGGPVLWELWVIHSLSN